MAGPGHGSALEVGVCVGLPSGLGGIGDWDEPEAPNPALSSECKIEHCEACFSHNFCTKCKESLYLHKGRCYPACPEGSAVANGTMECSSPGEFVGSCGLRGPGRGGESLGWGLCRESLAPTRSPSPDHPVGFVSELFCPWTDTASSIRLSQRAGGRGSLGVFWGAQL